jgi:hypothetical protein
MIYTQYLENYGAWDWDGIGLCPQYWKFKSAGPYFVSLPSIITPELIEETVAKVEPQVTHRNDYVEEYLVDWEVVSDDFLTPFEISQLEYEGVIRYSPQELVI